MTTQGTGNGSLQAQAAELAAQVSQVPERADVMAKALFSLRFADRWLAELVDSESVEMRGVDNRWRQRYRSAGREVDVVVERGVEIRVTGSVSPVMPGWVLLRSGAHRELIRLDEDGMFTAVIPDADSHIEAALEFDDGVTMTIRDIG